MRLTHSDAIGVVKKTYALARWDAVLDHHDGRLSYSTREANQRAQLKATTMALDFRILDGKTPVMASENEWATMLGDSDRCRIAVTEGEGRYVSTRFLGLNHTVGFGSPVLFETMLFRGDDWQGDYLTHACTWEEAERRHAEAVQIARKG